MHVIRQINSKCKILLPKSLFTITCMIILNKITNDNKIIDNEFAYCQILDGLLIQYCKYNNSIIKTEKATNL